MYFIFPYCIIAGSKLESVIEEGADALNAYIDSGEIEELADVITHEISDGSDNEENDTITIGDDEEEPDPKRIKTKHIKNHNAQVVYKNVDPNATIPSLMAINVPRVDGSLADGSGNQWSQPPPAMYNANTQNTNFMPSLLNLNLASPFDDSAGNWQSGRNDTNNRNNKPATKRRNRDSEGNRISRFDNNDNSRNNLRRNNNDRPPARNRRI